MTPSPTTLHVSVAGPDELPQCLALRRSIFIEEQGVPESIEMDGLEGQCEHLLLRQDGRAVGTARLRPVDGKAKAERVAVLPEARRHGGGRALMEALERRARELELSAVELHAQQAVIPFYEALGYVGLGDIFEEAGIPHLRMRRSLDRA